MAVAIAFSVITIATGSLVQLDIDVGKLRHVRKEARTRSLGPVNWALAASGVAWRMLNEVRVAASVAYLARARPSILFPLTGKDRCEI